MNSKRLKLFLSLGSSALILLLWGLLAPERLILTAQPEHIGEADAYITGVKIQQFNITGQLTHSIRSQRIRHMTSDDHTLIDNPQVTLYRPDKPPISATAGLGDIEPGHKVLWLRDNVKVYNQIDQSYRFETAYLKVTPDLHRVETDAAVSLYQPMGTTHATGMTANLADDTILLHDAVRGRYEPN